MLKKRRSWLSIAKSVVVFGLATFVSWMLIGVTVNIPAIRPIDQLTAAREVWEARAVKDYEMWVGVGSFGLIDAYKISVENDQVVSVLHGNLTRCDTCPLKPADSWTLHAYEYTFSGFFPPTLNDMTMDTLFAFAANKLKDEPAPPMLAFCSNADIERNRYEVTYEPTQGYITSLRYTNCARFKIGGGLMCPIMGDCNATITISGLEAKE
ncbi:MAG: hypothetical protein KF716_10935 [Anaerolineae bacterium]|nr:hypothetical protein [Anaerolineae bacterium]